MQKCRVVTQSFVKVSKKVTQSFVKVQIKEFQECIKARNRVCCEICLICYEIILHKKITIM
jgi:hypothetical protein